MDIKILNGDWEKSSCALPVTLSEEEALLQRAILRLKVPKGAFLHDSEFGSRFFEIDLNRRENADALALLFAREALAPLSDKIEVKSASVTDGGVSVCVILYPQLEARFII